MTPTTPRASYRIRVLGALRVEHDGVEVDLGGPKPRLLLAILLSNIDDLVTNDRLIDGMWGDEPPATARKAVQVHVSNLRRQLGTSFPLETERGGYRLASTNVDVDAVTFEHQVEDATAILTSRPHDAVRALTEAVAMWSGPAYADLVGEGALRAEITRLTELRLRATSRRLDAELRLGHHTEVVGELGTLATDHPYHEKFRALNMLALYRSGRQTDALRAFERTRSILVDELGIDPAPELQELHRQILEQSPELDLELPAGTPVDADQAGAQELAGGHAIRGYELRSRLGEGDHSTVYRAYQASVGREVAVKVIDAELANEQAFIGRFEAEAQFVARLVHPHIVPLHDYWRDPSGAYLVWQLMRGGSLARSLESAAWKPSAAMRVIDQIGGALAYAHRQGITHGRLKPTNVLLDEEGNAYLSDFGIAVPSSTDGGSSIAHLAPEQRNGGPVGPATDIYCLGALTYELLTGDRPAPVARPVADLVQGIPVDVDTAIARATESLPADRYDRVDDYLLALREAFGTDTAADQRQAPEIQVRNPFKGLQAFTETDTDDFFGRDDLVDELVAMVADRPLTAVVGPSGSGKSSLVKAGLIPRVRRGALGTTGDVLVTDMFPGSFPFEELEAALLRVAAHRPPGLLAELTGDDRGLLRVSKQILPDNGAELVLVIDQFEELFTLTTDEEVRRSFLDNLVTVGTDERRRVRVVVTMRADFFDRPLAHAEFGTLMRAGLATVAMPTHPELAVAIEEPVRRAGLELEPGLLPAIIRDVADEPGALPLLQYALTELVDGREGRVLSNDAYVRTGGVVGALATRAEETYRRLPPPGQDAAREVFLRLVAVDEDGNDTRRRVRRTELDNLGLNEPALAAVLDAYGSFRLLTFDHDPVTRGPTVEVAHEALIRSWPRYRDWIDSRREDLLLERRLAAAATEWSASEGDESFLLGGGRLEQYQQWASRTDFRLTANELEYLDASHFAADRRRAAEQHRIRRLRRLVVGIGVALVVALVAGAFAVVQQRRANDEAARALDATAEAEAQAQLAAEAADQADDQANLAAEAADDAEAQALLAAEAADEAELSTLISRSASVAADQQDLGLLLALEAHRRSPGPDTEEAVLGALGRSRLTSSIPLIEPSGTQCAGDDLRRISGDGLVEFHTVDGVMLRKDLVTGAVTEHGTSPGTCFIWSGDEELDTRWSGPVYGETFWFGPYNGELDDVFEANNGLLFADASYQGNRLVFGALSTVPGGRVTFVVLDASTWEEVARLPDVSIGPIDDIGPDGPRPLSFSSDGEMLVIATLSPTGLLPSGLTPRGEVVVLDAGTGAVLHRVQLSAPAQRTVFDTDRGELLIGTGEQRLLTVDLASGEIVDDVPTTATTDFLELGVRPDGLVVAVSEGQIELVDRHEGTTGTSVGLSGVDEARVRPDGSVLAVNHRANSADVFDLDITALIEESWAVGHGAVVEFVAGRAGVIDPDGGAEIVDLTTGERTALDLRTPDGEPFEALAVFPTDDGVVAFGGDGTNIARWSGSAMVDRVELQQTAGKNRFFPVVDSTGGITGSGPGFGGRGAVIAFGQSGPDEVYRLEQRGDRLDAVFVKDLARLSSAHPSEDGGVYVMNQFGRLRAYDRSGDLLDEISTDFRWMTVIDRDDATGRLAFGGVSGAMLLDPSTGTVEEVLGVGRTASVGFVRDGRLLLVVGDDGGVHLWDTDRRRSVELWIGNGGASPSPPWYDESTDSVWVATSGQLLRFPLDPQRWVDRACEVIGRGFTQAEWDQFVPGDEPLRSACS